MHSFKYSLTSLAILVVVVGLALDVFVSNATIKRLTTENESLRQRLRQAVEPNQLYWRRLPNELEWRIYLPAIHPLDRWEVVVVHPGGSPYFYARPGMCSVSLDLDPSRPVNGSRIVNVTVDHQLGTDRLAVTLGVEAAKRFEEAYRTRNVAQGWEFRRSNEDKAELFKADGIQLLLRRDAEGTGRRASI